MSQTDQDKSMDKKEIAEEEREKMLNAENTKHTGAAPAPDLESEDQKPKKKIPIGGIKMPGFCRTKSKEPCKDDETKPTETAEPESVTVTIKEGEHPLTTDKTTTPVKEVKDKEAKEKEGRKGILDAIRLPLVSVFPRKKNKEGDAELAMTGTAGLASVETLDDSGVNEKSAPTADDGMETVRLDGDVVEGVTPPKPHPIIVCLSTARRNLLVTVATFFILLAVIIIICIACAGPKRIVSPPLKDNKYIETITSCGPVQGVLEDGAFAFRGIPYALPPVNARRWLPAELFRRIEYCWNGTYMAHNASEMCWQREASGRIDGVEDCLYLDVFTPYVRYDSPLPVVVMIGAETLTGASPGIMQPSAKLARVRDVVFVRPNFRLGVFGFLASERLSRTIHPPTSGNYGLSDIVAALQWVQFNIENFGGDPKSVTLWGHRAGGTLVTALVGARKARGLFSRAWVSSGGTVFPRKSLQEYEELNEQYTNWLGCKDDTCLRNQGAEDLMKGIPETWYLGNAELPKPQETTSDKRHEWLVLDGAILQENVEQNWKQNGLPVKLVMGTTAQSGAPLHLLAPNASLESTEVVNKVRESLLGTRGLAEEALRRYNATLHGLTTMISDIRVVCPLLMLAKKNSTIPFYVATQPRGNLADPDSDAAAILGTYAARTPEEKRHVSAMQQLFNHFVWHGEVAQANSKGSKKILVVGQDILPQQDYPNCEFWINNNIVPTFARVD